MPRGIYNRQLSTPAARSSSKDTARTLAATTDTTPDKEPVKLTGPLVRALDTLRTVFTAFVADFKVLEMKRAELAPRFMKTFRKWQGETGGSFVAFVRVMVPDLPMDTKSYKAHSVYNAADYLRTMAARLEREGTTPVERARAIANRPASPRTAMARMMASFLPLIDPSALAALRTAMEEQLHWTTAQVDGIMDLVGTEQPIVRVRAPRGIHIAEHSLKLVAAPTPRTVETEDEDATTARTGTHG
jgi:hypothetical protein